MKLLITILLLIGQSYGQITKKDIAPLCLTFASGMCDGGAESLKFHYEKVDSKLNLNDKFWNPEISWKNKYKDGNPDNGAAFKGSTTCFVGVTDGYHLLRTGRNIMAITAITLKIGNKQKWWYYFLEAALFYLSYQIGFTITYEIFNT